jgi:hypothetical protein
MQQIPRILFFFLLSERILFAGLMFGQQAKIDSLKTVLLSAESDTLIVNTLNRLGNSFYNSGQLDSAIYRVTGALKLAEKISYKKAMGESFNLLGLISREQDKYKTEKRAGR